MLCQLQSTFLCQFIKQNVYIIKIKALEWDMIGKDSSTSNLSVFPKLIPFKVRMYTPG